MRQVSRTKQRPLPFGPLELASFDRGTERRSPDAEQIKRLADRVCGKLIVAAMQIASNLMLAGGTSVPQSRSEVGQALVCDAVFAIERHYSLPAGTSAFQTEERGGVPEENTVDAFLTKSASQTEKADKFLSVGCISLLAA